MVAAAASVCAAETYPSRPLHMIVPFPAGNASDTVGRLLAKSMAEQLGQPIVIENVGGAMSTIGGARAARSPSDGYTMMLATSATIAMAPHLYKNLSYGPQDFEPIAMLATFPFAMVVSGNSPVHDLKEFVAYAKGHEVNYGMGGLGGPGHLVAKMVESALGVEMTAIPYRGSVEMVPDLLGDRIQVYFDAVGTSLPLWRDGKIRILAVSGTEPPKGAESLPTFAESGYPSVVFYNTYSLVVPAQTPKPIIDQLNAAALVALKSEDVLRFLSNNATLPNPTTPEGAAQRLKEEYDAIGKLVRSTGIQLE
jgi:tripartite-type tricarboxylate transporter receptor subunit TctC